LFIVHSFITLPTSSSTLPAIGLKKHQHFIVFFWWNPPKSPSWKCLFGEEAVLPAPVAAQALATAGLPQAMADGEPTLVKGGPSINHPRLINHLPSVAQQAAEVQPQQLLWKKPGT
jgi:hypothetical protein